jgi:hypothetical protein
LGDLGLILLLPLGAMALSAKWLIDISVGVGLRFWGEYFWVGLIFDFFWDYFTRVGFVTDGLKEG